ncbi:MAG TPA: DUF1974 domain-containing protein, partial [Rhizobiales bacterium]|nr:DUF1974 domain-containing protein [Hyphomicrobiales bacterium]
FEDTGRPAEDLPLVHYACQSSLHAAETALNEAIRNFPVAITGWLLRGLVQPFGVRCKKPKDRLTTKVSNLISEPNAARDRLTSGIYVADDIELGRLQKAFVDMVALEPVKAKMRKARVRSAAEAEEKGIITGNEAAAMKAALAQVAEVARVDDFTLDEIKGIKSKRGRKAA